MILRRIQFPFLMLFVLAILTSACSELTIPGEMDRDTYLKILNEKLPYTNSGKPGVYPPDSPVAVNGELQVIGAQLCDERGKPVQLCGLFLRGLYQESRFINQGAISWCAGKWKMDVFRVPFYTDTWYGDPSYINQPGYEYFIHEAVRLCEESGIYCIIDWHILRDGNPFVHAKDAWKFFKKMAFLYGAKKHVIFEICNEPNGQNVKWDNVIKPYAEYIIPAIRAGNSNAIIIVGTGSYSRDVQDAAANPLSYPNILYSFHFYAMEYDQKNFERTKAASEEIALFCTEWGTTGGNALGGPDLVESRKWLQLLNSRKIGWCNYALTDFPEDAALFKSKAKPTGGWDNTSLSLSGQFVIDLLTNR